MSTRSLLVAAFTVLVPALAYSAVDPITGFDTTSATDVAFRGRGLTLASHTGEVSLRAQWVINNDAPNDFALRPGFAFGVTGNLELGAEAIIFLERDSHVYFAPRLVYQLIDTKAVDIAMTGFLMFDFDGNDNNLLPTRQFGVPIRIKLGDSFAIYTGNNAVSWVHLANGDDIIDLNINVGLSFQASGNLALRFDTQIAAVNLVGPRDSTTISDILPLGVSVVYAIASHVDFIGGATYYSVNGPGDWLLLEGGLLARF